MTSKEEASKQGMPIFLLGKFGSFQLALTGFEVQLDHLLK
jgi:hypothetical protein